MYGNTTVQFYLCSAWVQSPALDVLEEQDHLALRLYFRILFKAAADQWSHYGFLPTECLFDFLLVESIKQTELHYLWYFQSSSPF